MPGEQEQGSGQVVAPEAWRAVGELATRMQLDLDREWTLAELARVVGYEAHHLVHVFHAVLGVPPIRYLRLLRLERAAYALLGGRATIREIAAEAGYETAEAFTRAFRRSTGASPTTFRARAWRPDERWAARPRPRALAPLDRAPAGLLASPRLELSGPLYGWTLRVDDDWSGVAEAFAALIAVQPVSGPWQLGGLAQPRGWVRGPLGKDLRCVRFVAADASPPPPPLLAWRQPPTWHAIFDYVGALAGIAAACAWIVGEWCPRSGLRPAFAPVVSRVADLAEEPRCRVRLLVPTAGLAPAFAALTGGRPGAPRTRPGRPRPAARG